MKRVAAALLLLVVAACGSLGGDRARVPLDLVFEGNETIASSRLVEIVAPVLETFEKGERARSSVDDAAYEIEREYAAEGFASARADWTYDEPTDEKPKASFRITEGPRTEVSDCDVRGAERVRGSVLRGIFEAVAFADPNERWYVEERVQSAAQAVEDELLERGYFAARVPPPQVVLSPDGASARITIVVHEGERHVLARVDVRDDPLGAGSAKLFEDLIDAPYRDRVALDVQGRIEAFYGDRGHPDVRVQRVARNVETSARVVLAFVVTAGPHVVVGKVSVHGDARTRKGFVRARSKLVPGEPWKTSRERATFAELYRTGLFERVEIVPVQREKAPTESTPTPGKDAESSTSAVDRGDGVAFAPGIELQTTPSGSDVEPIDAEQRGVQSDATEPDATQPDASQQDATQLGTTQQGAAKQGEAKQDRLSSDVEKQDPANPARAEPRDPSAADEPPPLVPEEVVRDVEIRLVESPPLELFAEPGYGSYERERLTLGVRERNLFGIALVLDARGTVGPLAQRGEVRLIDPFFAPDVRADVRVFAQKREEPSFERLEIGAGFGVTRRMSDTVEVAASYEYRRSDVTDVDADGVLDVDELANDVDISSILVSATFDERDSPFRPTEGLYSKAQVELADDGLGSQLSFLRLRLTTSWFRPLWEGGVFGTSWKTGWIAPFGPTEVIPLQERFFNGGENTVRSFSEQELGPLDADGDPIGGEAFHVVSIEVRQRIKGRIEGALFFDVGNVALRHQDWADFDDLRQGIGAGLRYELPVGPIRLDGAINPDPDGDESRGALHLSVGLAF